MAVQTVQTTLTLVWALCGTAGGGLAAYVLYKMRRRGASVTPPFRYGPGTLRDFEFLAAAASLVLFGSFVYITAALYDHAALQVASRIPFTMFTIVLTGLLYRWGRRV